MNISKDNINKLPCENSYQDIKVIFNDLWGMVSDEEKACYKLEFKIKHENNIADVIILLNTDIVAIGKYFDKLKPLKNEWNTTYFRMKDGFLSNYNPGNVWFYFDQNNIIINDISFKNPGDELMENPNEFFNRLFNSK